MRTSSFLRDGDFYGGLVCRFTFVPLLRCDILLRLGRVPIFPRLHQLRASSSGLNFAPWVLTTTSPMLKGIVQICLIFGPIGFSRLPPVDAWAPSLLKNEIGELGDILKKLLYYWRSCSMYKMMLYWNYWNYLPCGISLLRGGVIDGAPVENTCARKFALYKIFTAKPSPTPHFCSCTAKYPLQLYRLGFKV